MRGIINLSDLSGEKLIIEEGEKLEKSIFNAVYRKTGMLLETIISKNKSLKDESGKCEEKKATQREINNVISFVGRRGTGKTSAMFSVYEALKINHAEYLIPKNENYAGGCDAYFQTIEPIDASMMEDQEDIRVDFGEYVFEITGKG